MKFCKDCRWFVMPGFVTVGQSIHENGRCCSPRLPRTPIIISPVSGGQYGGEPVEEYCSILRKDYNHIAACGPEGKWWEEKA